MIVVIISQTIITPRTSVIVTLLIQDGSKSNYTRIHTLFHSILYAEGFVDLHRWVYAIGVRMIDRCWGGSMIHIGWVPTCWVWIGCSKPVLTHTGMHVNPR